MLQFADVVVDLTLPPPPPVNRAPLAVADTAAVFANAGATTLNVLANDTDPDAGDTKTVVSVDGNGRPGGIVITAVTYGVGVGFIDPGTPAILGAVALALGGQGIVYDPAPPSAFWARGRQRQKPFSTPWPMAAAPSRVRPPR
ncbi:MAG: hypothetical protein FJY37_01635 [Betaproteobacteria bacterium]|nr:hypothetical protein [Betaproteobacteria bacterium]